MNVQGIRSVQPASFKQGQLRVDRQDDEVASFLR